MAMEQWPVHNGYPLSCRSSSLLAGVFSKRLAWVVAAGCRPEITRNARRNHKQSVRNPGHTRAAPGRFNDRHHTAIGSPPIQRVSNPRHYN